MEKRSRIAGRQQSQLVLDELDLIQRKVHDVMVSVLPAFDEFDESRLNSVESIGAYLQHFGRENAMLTELTRVEIAQMRQIITLQQQYIDRMHGAEPADAGQQSQASYLKGLVADMEFQIAELQEQLVRQKIVADNATHYAETVLRRESPALVLSPTQSSPSFREQLVALGKLRASGVL